ncbi:anti-phage deoxyguanosine triphosphatase [Roseomonas mucosa]|uniref:anti-phage deoxyguanosine triphosphatase n=1 Tax=Roseomonas mucosa TaxID=207340 RepID=UPI0030D56780
MTYTSFEEFGERFWNAPAKRSGDVRSPYERDRGRVIHSAAFRRLQGKTQVMGAGEGDFHRTRLTHSIECAQIGAGLLQVLEAKRFTLPQDLQPWLPERDLVEAACFAHDLGHPPFGHGGEQALQARMWNQGGFEGNGQTLRIITKLEKYTAAGWGTNPTRRLILAVLKYPIPYSGFSATDHKQKPPKCYFDEERPLVEWALSALPAADVSKLAERDEKLKARHRTFDCSLMELADDIAYGVHDIEDIVARQLATKEHVLSEMTAVFNKLGSPVLQDGEALTAESITRDLFGGGFERKRRISALVNLFVTSVAVERKDGFSHPLLAYRVTLSTNLDKLLDGLKKMAFSLVISHAEVRQLEERGKRVVAGLLEVLAQKPGELVPAHSWAQGDGSASDIRRVCDYVAGMTDAYAERVYRRLFIPGSGSSRDEL